MVSVISKCSILSYVIPNYQNKSRLMEKVTSPLSQIILRTVPNQTSHRLRVAPKVLHTAQNLALLIMVPSHTSHRLQVAPKVLHTAQNLALLIMVPSHTSHRLQVAPKVLHTAQNPARPTMVPSQVVLKVLHTAQNLALLIMVPSHISHPTARNQVRQTIVPSHLSHQRQQSQQRIQHKAPLKSKTQHFQLRLHISTWFSLSAQLKVLFPQVAIRKHLQKVQFKFR